MLLGDWITGLNVERDLCICEERGSTSHGPRTCWEWHDGGIPKATAKELGQNCYKWDSAARNEMNNSCPNSSRLYDTRRGCIQRSQARRSCGHQPTAATSSTRISTPILYQEPFDLVSHCLDLVVEVRRLVYGNAGANDSSAHAACSTECDFLCDVNRRFGGSLDCLRLEHRRMGHLLKLACTSTIFKAIHTLVFAEEW